LDAELALEEGQHDVIHLAEPQLAVEVDFEALLEVGVSRREDAEQADAIGPRSNSTSVGR
jgi:hypothetical protein